METRRLGVFGGTFDPPHLGHVRAVAAARDQLALDRLIVTVANDPWRKPESPTASPALRLDMARAAFSGMDRVEVSDLEIVRGGPTYTVDTVEALLASDPKTSIVVILGADAAAGLREWHRAGTSPDSRPSRSSPGPAARSPNPARSASRWCRWTPWTCPARRSATPWRRVRTPVNSCLRA